MNNLAKNIIIVSVVLVAFLLLVASVYVMTAGMGSPCAAHLKGSIKRTYISPDGSVVRYRISLQLPEEVKNWSHLYLCMNISGKTFALQYNSSARIWMHGNYTARLYDVNHNEIIDTGDEIEFENLEGSFRQGDEALICVCGYSGNIPAPLW